MKNSFRRVLEKILSTISMVGFIGMCLFLTAFLIWDISMLVFKLISYIWGYLN